MLAVPEDQTMLSFILREMTGMTT